MLAKLMLFCCLFCLGSGDCVEKGRCPYYVQICMFNLITGTRKSHQTNAFRPFSFGLEKESKDILKISDDDFFSSEYSEKELKAMVLEHSQDLVVIIECHEEQLDQIFSELRSGLTTDVRQNVRPADNENPHKRARRQPPPLYRRDDTALAALELAVQRAQVRGMHSSPEIDKLYKKIAGLRHVIHCINDLCEQYKKMRLKYQTPKRTRASIDKEHWYVHVVFVHLCMCMRFCL